MRTISPIGVLVVAISSASVIGTFWLLAALYERAGWMGPACYFMVSAAVCTKTLEGLIEEPR